jgi:uncharacterized protein (DUF433 family)
MQRKTVRALKARREHRLTVRLTDEEERILVRRAAAAGMTRTAFVRQLIALIEVMNSSTPNQNLVVSDPEILSGEPVFAGTRITIDTVLASLAAGIDVARIRESYPIVSDQHIKAARAYRAEHPRSRQLRISERHPDLKAKQSGSRSRLLTE